MSAKKVPVIWIVQTTSGKDRDEAINLRRELVLKYPNHAVQVTCDPHPADRGRKDRVVYTSRTPQGIAAAKKKAAAAKKAAGKKPAAKKAAKKKAAGKGDDTEAGAKLESDG